MLLSARRVGPTGKAYGLDMTDEMLALARENQRKAGVDNVEFLKGEIENIPLPDNSVDVIISNCVINLPADKDRVLREAFRVLKPGAGSPCPTWWSGAKSRPRSEEASNSGLAACRGALGGLLSTQQKLRRGRVRAVSRSSRPAFTTSRMPGGAQWPGHRRHAIAPQVGGKFMSAFVRAYKPAQASLLWTNLLRLTCGTKSHRNVILAWSAAPLPPDETT